MNYNDKPAFNRAFNNLAIIYRLSDYEDRRDLYFQSLEMVPMAALEFAFKEAGRQAGTGACRFFPLPGVLQELSKQTREYKMYQPGSSSYKCSLCDGLGWERVTVQDPLRGDEYQAMRICACKK